MGISVTDILTFGTTINTDQNATVTAFREIRPQFKRTVPQFTICVCSVLLLSVGNSNSSRSRRIKAPLYWSTDPTAAGAEKRQHILKGQGRTVRWQLHRVFCLFKRTVSLMRCGRIFLSLENAEVYAFSFSSTALFSHQQWTLGFRNPSQIRQCMQCFQKPDKFIQWLL